LIKGVTPRFFSSMTTVSPAQKFRFHKALQEPICHIRGYLPPFVCVCLSSYSVHLRHSRAPLFTEALCLDMSSLGWWRVCFLSNVTGRSSASTGGQGGNERLLAEDMGAAASKRGENSLTILPRHGSPYEEQCQGGSEKFCDDIRVWGLRRLPAPSYSGTSKEPFSQAQTTSPQTQHVSQKRVIPHHPVQKCASSTTSSIPVTHTPSRAQKAIMCVDASLSAHSLFLPPSAFIQRANTWLGRVPIWLKKKNTQIIKDGICLQCGRPGFNPWVRRSPGKGNDNPLQYSCLENPLDGGALQALGHGVTKSWTWLSG